MQTVKPEAIQYQNLSELKEILSAEGPCLSLYLPLSSASKEGKNPNAKQNELNWKRLVHDLEERVSAFGETGRELVQSLQWEEVVPAEVQEGKSAGCSLAILRSPSVFQVMKLDGELPGQAVVGPHFCIRPLLPILTRPQTFYLLALSRNDTRLLRCTHTSSEEVALPESTKTSFEEWMNQSKPDRNLVYNAMAAGAQGSAGPSALAPKGADQDAKDKYVGHYFKQLDQGVAELLKGSDAPLVICSVEQNIPLYRNVNTYPNLVSTEVRGAPNGLKAGEMHARAITALEEHDAIRIEDALADWNHRVGAGASSRLKEVVAAAHEGRVLNLLVSDSHEHTGVFDETTYTVKGKETGTPDDEDLVNDAVVQAVLHSSKVLLVPHKKMPNGSPVAATFRY